MNFILNLLEFNTKIQYSAIFTLLGLYFLLLWGSFIVYVWRDSKLYCDSDLNSSRRFFVVITVLFGFGGLLIYLLFRGDSIEQERLFRIENELLQREAWLCPKCLETVVNDERFCVNCGRVTKKKCESCGSFNQPDNKYCQSCGERFPLVQTNDSSTAKFNDTRKLTVRRQVDKLWKKFCLEIKNSRNFKMEPPLASLLKRKYSKNNKIQKFAKK